jgi:hypothetical protein
MSEQSCLYRVPLCLHPWETIITKCQVVKYDDKGYWAEAGGVTQRYERFTEREEFHCSYEEAREAAIQVVIKTIEGTQKLMENCKIDLKEKETLLQKLKNNTFEELSFFPVD